LVLLLMGFVFLLWAAPQARADQYPPGCDGSGLGISLFISPTTPVHVGDTLNYSVLVFNAPASVCQASQLKAWVVTPNGVTNFISLSRTNLLPEQSDSYGPIAYVVRQQDIQPDGTLKATATVEGMIHQNEVLSRGGAYQGVNTVVSIPCVRILAQCVNGTGENGAITFSGTVQNCGAFTLHDITVNNFVNGGQYTVTTIGSLAGGQTTAFNGSWTPANPCSPSTATLVARGTDGYPGNSFATNSVTITCQNTLTPGIDVTQVCSEGPVGPGGSQGFTGTVRNTGNVTLTNVVVVNTLGGTVFGPAPLAPGQQQSFSGNYNVPTNSCSTTSTSTATGRSICGVQVTDAASSTCSILTAPSIQVSAFCPEIPPVAGGTLSQNVTVVNTGDVPLYDIAVYRTAQSATTKVRDIASLAPGASTIFISSLAVPANVCSIPTAFEASGRDNCSGNVTNRYELTCPIGTAPSIDVTLACPAQPAAVGGTIVYSGTVRNTGDVTLNSVAVVNSEGGTISSVPASLTPGASANFTATFTAPADSCSMTRTVAASGVGNCPNGGPVTDSASATCSLTTSPGIDVTQNCSETQTTPGGTQSFTGTVRNTGNVTLTNVVVANTLGGTVFGPAALAPGQQQSFSGSYTVPTNSCSTTSTSTATGRSICGVQVTDAATTTCPILTAPAILITAQCPETTPAGGGTLIHGVTVSNLGNVPLYNIAVYRNPASANTKVKDIASLAPGASTNFTSSLAAPANTCSLLTVFRAVGTDNCSGNVTNQFELTCPIGTAPSIDVTLACPAQPAAAGGTIVYSGTVRNTGDVTLNSVAVVNSEGGTISSVPASLTPGASANFTATFTAPADSCSMTRTVAASGVGNCPNGGPVTDSASATCSLTTSPGIDVTQNCSETQTTPGGTQSFTGTVRNTGNVTLTNVVVANTLGGTVFGPAALAPGQQQSFSGSYTVPTNSCSTTSTSTATGRSICGVQVTDAATTTCPILTAPAIVVTAVCPTTTVSPGGSLTYSGTVRNAGNVTLTDVRVISDRPAANTTVFTAASLLPGASASFTGTYTVPADVCSVTANLQATGKDQCTLQQVANSFVSTCPVGTAPAIDVTLACQGQSTNVIPGQNLALGRGNWTEQSSTLLDITGGNWWYFSPEYAVDGHLSGVYTDHAMSITLWGTDPWWQVDLGSVQNIGTINLWGRTDGFANNGTNVDVLVSDSPIPANLQDALNQSGIGVYQRYGTLARPSAFEVNRTGRYVKIQMAGYCNLALAEVEVYSQSVAPPPVVATSFTGTVRNTGNIALNNVSVVDNLGGTVSAVPATLSVGQSATFTVTFPTPPVDQCTINSTVVATGSDICGGSPVSDTASAACALPSHPRITVTQECLSSAPVGGMIAYSGSVSNAGDVTLTDVVVVNDRTGSTIVFTRATLSPGEVASFNGSYLVPAGSGCTITSTLTASGKDKCTTALVSATASATCTVTTSPRIVVTQTCPTTLVPPGGILTYSGIVSNAGDVTLTDIVVVSDQPAANTVIYTANSLAPGAKATFTGSYTVPPNCCVSSSTVGATGRDICTGATVADTFTATCTALTLPKIVVTKVCPAEAVRPGEVLEYSGTVSNAGTITLVDVMIENSQPTPGPIFGPIALAPGESVPYYSSYVVPSSDFCGTDTVTARGYDSCTLAQVNSSATTTCPIDTTPRIAVTMKCPDSATPHNADLHFTGTVRNDGNVTLTDVYVVNSQPSNNTPVVGPLTLAPGATEYFSGSFRTPKTCCTIVSTLTARGKDRCSTEMVYATATGICDLLNTPSITVTKDCPSTEVPVGGLFSYTGSVSNSGDTILTNVYVVSSAPAANTHLLGPIELGVGETKWFSGSYIVTAGANPVTDTVTATGVNTCKGIPASSSADCTGTLIPFTITKVSVVNGVATVSWNAKAGTTYRLQSKSSWQDPNWATVPGDVTATGTTASKSTAVGTAPQGLYRVVKP